jgi:tetratricopeptide (TPR) repeat protein
MTHAKTCIRVGLVVCVALMMTVLPRDASGQLTDEQKKQAKTHFKAGQAFLQMERYAEAIEEFNQAYEITQDKLVMGQVANAYEKAGDYEAALKAMELYREALPEGDRGSADGFITKYKKAIAEGKSKKLTLPSEQKPVAPVKMAENEEERAIPPAEEPEEEGGKSKRFYTWIAAGAAGALALSALVVGLNAQSKYDELSDTCKPNCPQSDVDSVETRALVTDILWGTAAAAAVTAGVLYFLEGRKLKGEERSTPVEGEDEEEVMNRVRVTPVVGGGTFGVGANVRF